MAKGLRIAAFNFALFAVISSVSNAYCAPGENAISIAPASVTVVTRQAQQFKVVADGSYSLQLKWSVSGVLGGNAQVGTISSSGLYTAPSAVSSSSIVVSAVEAADGRVVASAPVTLAEDPAVEQAHEEWLAGAARAAAEFGCGPDLIQQLPTESVTDVIHLFALTATKGTCVVLLPVSTEPGSIRYSFASGGDVDGTEIHYLSDVGQMRIRNGVAVAGN